MEAKTHRIERDLEALSKCTEGEGPGVCRLTFSAAENAARAYLRSEMLQAGLAVRTDAAGNVIGRLEGSDPSLPVIMIGSHMDSIRNGGNFDGMAGIVAGIECARLFRDQGLTPLRGIDIVGFTGEENSRFYPGQLGSRAIAGTLSVQELYSARDGEGMLLADAMREAGFDPERIGEAAYAPESLLVYFELHIEQCSVLERSGTDVGVVNCISGACHHKVKIFGVTDHAGGTPMNMRSDAMLAAAEYALSAEQVAVEIGHDTVATVGSLTISPNIPNVICGEVNINTDIRSTEMSYNEQVMETLEKTLQGICTRRGCSFEARREYNSEPVHVPEALQELLSRKAEEQHISNRRIYSGAGHDSIRINKLCPVAMLFVPSRGGLSHCPEEWTDYEYIAKGAQVLFGAVRELADSITFIP